MSSARKAACSARWRSTVRQAAWAPTQCRCGKARAASQLFAGLPPEQRLHNAVIQLPRNCEVPAVTDAASIARAFAETACRLTNTTSDGPLATIRSQTVDTVMLSGEDAVVGAVLVILACHGALQHTVLPRHTAFMCLHRWQACREDCQLTRRQMPPMQPRQASPCRQATHLPPPAQPPQR